MADAIGTVGRTADFKLLKESGIPVQEVLHIAQTLILERVAQAKGKSGHLIAQAIDLYSGKSRGQWVQRDGLQSVMRWSAKQRISHRASYEYAVLPATQELSRCTLQLRGDPDVPAVEKRTERIERSTVQPDADRAAELFPVLNCVPAPGQTLSPCKGLRSLGERHAIGISEIEAHGTAKFLRAATR